MKLRPLALAAAFGAAFAAGSACYYNPYYYDCYYYYGYYDPYCYYDYYGYYGTSGTYSTMSYAEVEVEETPHPDPALGTHTTDDTVDVENYVYLAPNGSDENPPDLSDFADRYPCNESSETTLTLCSGDPAFDVDVEYLLVAFQLRNPLPQEDDTNFFAVTFAFDSNSDVGDNYQPPAELANDYTGSTDRWYVASHTPDDGWRLDAFSWNGNAPEAVDTAARVIIEEQSAAIVVPRSEFEAPVPGSRIALFRHTGDSGENGDWSGLVYPPLSAPLAGP